MRCSSPVAPLKHGPLAAEATPQEPIPSIGTKNARPSMTRRVGQKAAAPRGGTQHDGGGTT